VNWNIITLFPQMVGQALAEGVVGQAFQKGRVRLKTVNPRDFTIDVHHTVDDRPFGGGDGMVMQQKPLQAAMDSLGEQAGHRVLLSPHGRKWSDSLAREWASRGGTVTLVCGRYGGIDQRFINRSIDEEISIGDFILSGGEFGALVLVDSVVRLLPQVLGNEESPHEESFAGEGLLEAPLFTRPQSDSVPQVFLSGDHKKIREARRVLSLLVTEKKRPDLLQPSHRRELTQLRSRPLPFTTEELVACGLAAPVLSNPEGASS
jgi:tRNA (guanine37-N1)-methyltransferase